MERNYKMDELKRSILTYETTRRSAFEKSTPQQHSFSSQRCYQTPAEKEYRYEHFNRNSIYMKHHRQSDEFSRCPHCGHSLTGYAKTLFRRDKALLTYSCPRPAPSKCNLLRRRISSLFRPKYVAAMEEKVDRPIFCNACQQRVITKYVEQKWCVTPLFKTKDSTSRRPANSSSYKNMIRDHYAKRLPNRSLEISSNSLLTDTESEHFVRTTNYSYRNQMEDDLKQELIKEYFKRKQKRKRYRVVSSSSNSKCSSKQYANFVFNDAKPKFTELNHMSKDNTEPKFDQACYAMNTTSSAHLSKTKGTEGHTVLTQTCCGCACHCANEFCPSRRKGCGNSNIQLNKKSSKSSLKESLSKFCSKFMGSNATKTGNDDILRDSKSEKGVKIEVKNSLCVCGGKNAKLSKDAKTKMQANVVPKHTRQKDSKVNNGTATDLKRTFTEKSNILESNTSRNSRLPANNTPLQNNSSSRSHSDMHSKSSVHLDASSATRLEPEPISNSARTSGSSDLQSEEQYSPHETSTKQQVMFINHPSCIVVKGGQLHLSQENGVTQTGVNNNNTEKARSNNKDEKSCQCDCGKNCKIQTRPASVKFESGHTVTNSNYRQCQRPKGACERNCGCQTDQKSAMKINKPHHVMQSVMIDDSQDRYQQQILDRYQSHRQADKVVQSVCVHDPPCELVPSCFKVKYKLDLLNYCVHVPLCARVPMCSLPEDEKSRFEDLSSRQFISRLKGNAGTQVAMMARTPCMAVQAPYRTVQAPCRTVQTPYMAVKMPCMAVQTCNAQRTWISAHDQTHQTPVEQPPMSATCPTCAHVVCSSNFDGSVLGAKIPLIQNQKPKSSFVSGQNRFLKIFSRHKRSS